MCPTLIHKWPWRGFYEKKKTDILFPLSNLYSICIKLKLADTLLGMTPPHPSPQETVNYKTQKAKAREAERDCFQCWLCCPCKMTGKIILCFTFAPTYVTLKRIFIPMTSHVDGVKDIVGKVHVTVLAVVEKLRVLTGRVGAGVLGWLLLRLEYLCGHCSLLGPATWL